MSFAPRQIAPLFEKLASQQAKEIESTYSRAAVSLIVCKNEKEYSLLFLERSDTLKNHAGQVSLPGGRVEDVDENVLATALRETEEETAITLDVANCIGQLDDFITNSYFHLSTFVFLIEGRRDVTLSSEHKAYFYAPLTALQNKANQRHYKANYLGKTWDMHEYNVESHRIWGVTGWIVNQFLSLLPA
jgi:8-oxo-dGTP pyrophosphatase MutT (NUDIX family)